MVEIEVQKLKDQDLIVNLTKKLKLISQYESLNIKTLDT